jgi:hypothetical protein
VCMISFPYLTNFTDNYGLENIDKLEIVGKNTCFMRVILFHSISVKSTEIFSDTQVYLGMGKPTQNPRPGHKYVSPMAGPGLDNAKSQNKRPSRQPNVLSVYFGRTRPGLDLNRRAFLGPTHRMPRYIYPTLLYDSIQHFVRSGLIVS